VAFRYYLPTKIIFGEPAVEAITAELTALSAGKVLLVSDPGLADLGVVQTLTTALETVGYTVSPFTHVSSNPTTIEVSAGLEQAQQANAEALIGLGGGSAIDVAKSIAMLLANGGTYADYQWGGKRITKPSTPLLAIPTTAGTGSEVSKVAVIVDPDNPFKKGVLSPLMFPYAAILDPELTRSMPPWLTAATGMDAFIHALEAFTGKRANSYTDHLALAALKTIWHRLPEVTANGQDMNARREMLLASLWAGTAMDHAGLGLIHSLSGPLTGHLHLHHGLANALLLPYVMAFNLPSIQASRRVTLTKIFHLPANATDADITNRLTRFVEQLGLPTKLSDLDKPLTGVDWSAIAEETTKMVLLANNPRSASVAECLTLLQEMQ
jgi:alcohol dehydrogenase class IV